MATGTLYTCKENFRADKVLIAAEYGKAKLQVNSDSPSFVFGETNRSEQFLKKFPLGKVPAFETKDGQAIVESNAIAYYVANQQLRGSNDVEKSQVIQYMSFSENEILPAMAALVYPCLGAMQQNKQAQERAREDVKKILTCMNTHLESRTFLVGERITLADISVFATLLPLYKMVLEPACRKPFQNTNRWFMTMLNQPEVKKVVGNVVLCEKAAQFDAKLFAEINKKPSGGAPAAKADKKAEAKQKKKSESEAAAPAEEMDGLSLEPKQKDPFDALPKGTFVMDDFKRSYSNESEDVSIKFFWDKFDKDNYSIWHCEYKYPEELTKVFMSCNLIGGMMQRLDKMRKHAFASMCLFGEDNKSTISGIWVWRGHDLAFELSPDWQVDYESYTWKKLDPTDANVRKMVDAYLRWDAQINGQKFNQGKIFK